MSAAPDLRTSLSTLAAKAKQEHGLVLQAEASALLHAIAAGDVLREIKAQVPRGRWEVWLFDNLPDIALNTISHYMRLSKHKALIEEQQPRTVTDALRVVAGAPDTRHDEDLIDQARRMYQAGGVTMQDVAERLGNGVTKAQVWNWCNPQKVEKRNARARARSMAGRRELTRRARESAVKKKGGDIAEAYALVRKALQALERAQEAEQKPEVRAAVRSAMDRLYKAEDEIGKAVRLS